MRRVDISSSSYTLFFSFFQHKCYQIRIKYCKRAFREKDYARKYSARYHRTATGDERIERKRMVIQLLFLRYTCFCFWKGGSSFDIKGRHLLGLASYKGKQSTMSSKHLLRT